MCWTDFAAGTIDILNLLVKCGLAASKGEARRLVQPGGVGGCGEKVTDIGQKRSCADCGGEGIVIRKGKKSATARRLRGTFKKAPALKCADA